MRRLDNDDLAYLLGLIIGIAGLVVFGFVELREARWVGANDFSGIWAGGRALALGLDPYDPSSWRATAVSLQGQVPETAVYGYPGWIAVAMVPLGSLPLRIASLVWVVAGMALAAIALRALLRDRVPGLPAVHTLVALALVLSQPALLAFYDGQWSFVLIALMCFALLARRRPALAGAAAAVALLAKPQLFLLAIPALARNAPRRAVGVAVAVVLAAVVISLVVAPGWPTQYSQHVLSGRLPDRPRATTLPTALFDLFGPAGLWLAAATLVGLAVISLGFGRGDAGLAAALALSIAFAPYAWSYDQLLLLVPIVLSCGVLARRSRLRALALATIGAGLLLVGGTLLHGLYADARASESLNGLISAGIAGLVTALLWPHRGARLNSPNEGPSPSRGAGPGRPRAHAHGGRRR